MSTDDTPTPGATLHQILNVFDEVRRKALKESSAQQQRKVYGLTVRQSAAINQVMTLTHDTPEGISLKTLAKHMQMAVSATSILVEGIVSKGIFVRTQNPRDRRTILIRLSEKGVKFLDETNKRIRLEMAALASMLSPAELDSLTQISRKLLAACPPPSVQE